MPSDEVVRRRGVRISLAATAYRPAGRHQRWTVEAAERWRAEGPTEKAAADALTAGLQTFLESYREPVVLSFRGYTVVLALDLAWGPQPRPIWLERTIRPDGTTSSSGRTAESWQDAEASARYTLAQRTTDWPDNASVHEAAFLARATIVDDRYGPDELLRYAAWQRAAAAAISAAAATGTSGPATTTRNSPWNLRPRQPTDHGRPVILSWHAVA
ncbi:hypothetical protein [Actinoplanes sp. NPDC026619]|uniref:hypothetical protein n=1 Tax=Actinoplanes sp. NPDC026619 TaxID=3155798 RepID=UPI00340C5A6F